MALSFSILTLFPDQIMGALDHSITGRALARGLIEVVPVQIRDFAVNDYGQADDSPYGGGRGMVMMCEPVYQAWESVGGEEGRTLYLSPAGRVFDQALALELSREEKVTLICGHYEGIDRRVIDEIGAEEVSIGNFILTGGELAAAVMIDAISRLVPGVLPDEEAWQLESFSDGLLEWPPYTRPAVWRGREVPSVLLSGHQARIDREREVMALSETLKKKPQLLEKRAVNLAVWEDLAEKMKERLPSCEDCSGEEEGNSLNSSD